MSGIIAKDKGGSFELCPPGNHLARCYSMVEIGTVFDETFNVSRHLVRISWELPNEQKVFDQNKGPQPFSIHKEYTLSMNEKANLRHDLESWRGKGFTEEEGKAFDITKLLGVACMLNVIHKQNKKGNQIAVIGSISPIPKGMECPPQVNASFMLSYADWDSSKFNSLPDWLKKRMEETAQFHTVLTAGNDVPIDDKSTQQEDDLPF